MSVCELLVEAGANKSLKDKNDLTAYQLMTQSSSTARRDPKMALLMTDKDRRSGKRANRDTFTSDRDHDSEYSDVSMDSEDEFLERAERVKTFKLKVDIGQAMRMRAWSTGQQPTHFGLGQASRALGNVCDEYNEVKDKIEDTGAIGSRQKQIAKDRRGVKKSKRYRKVGRDGKLQERRPGNTDNVIAGLAVFKKKQTHVAKPRWKTKGVDGVFDNEAHYVGFTAAAIAEQLHKTGGELEHREHYGNQYDSETEDDTDSDSDTTALSRRKRRRRRNPLLGDKAWAQI